MYASCTLLSSLTLMPKNTGTLVYAETDMEIYAHFRTLFLLHTSLFTNLSVLHHMQSQRNAHTNYLTCTSSHISRSHLHDLFLHMNSYTPSYYSHTFGCYVYDPIFLSGKAVKHYLDNINICIFIKSAISIYLAKVTISITAVRGNAFESNVLSGIWPMEK